MDVSRNRPNELFTFWLMPAAPEKDLFSELIKTLAHELKAPLFPPHLTLFSARLPINEARRIFADFESDALSLTIAGVAHSSQFSKTLFLRFRSNSALSRLTSNLQRRAGIKPRQVTDPHLSLCYKKLAPSVRRDLSVIIRMPFRKVCFDRVTVALCGSQTRTAADVKAWRTVSTVPLHK